MTKWETQPSGRMDRSLVLCCTVNYRNNSSVGEEQSSRLKSRAGVSGSFVSCMSSSHLLLPFNISPVTTFLWNCWADFMNWDSIHLISEGKKTASAGRLTCIIWIKTDLFLWVTVYKWMKVLWQLRNYCKINNLDAHIFVCSYILSKRKWKEEVSVIQVDPEGYFFLTQ